jgi:hypothetical protein
MYKINLSRLDIVEITLICLENEFICFRTCRKYIFLENIEI